MNAHLILEDGTTLTGEPFGAPQSAAGEVVFNTGMVGYPEAMTDPSYRGQVLVFTYPLIGNYGIPVNGKLPGVSTMNGLSRFFESETIHVKGIVVSSLTRAYSHWAAVESLDAWMRAHHVPGLCGVDTRALTKRLRTNGCMLGKIIVNDQEVDADDPNQRNVVAEVSVGEARWYPADGERRVILVDFGCKHHIVRSLNARGLNVLKVPWNYDWSHDEADGVVLSNGPGDPAMCAEAIRVIRAGLDRDLPILGICLGHQLLALAAGGETYKLKYGHRGQNQPCIEVGSRRCFITSQNHGFAVNEESLPAGWQPWFFNANDGTNEGIRHGKKPVFSVQFHPEAHPGPVDTTHIFDLFVQSIVQSINHQVLV